MRGYYCYSFEYYIKSFYRLLYHTIDMCTDKMVNKRNKPHANKYYEMYLNTFVFMRQISGEIETSSRTNFEEEKKK